MATYLLAEEARPTDSAQQGANTDPPMIHSVGLAMPSGEMLILCRKGTPLPARARVVFTTDVQVRRGQSEPLIKIPVLEGENVKRADRNQLIGVLEIPAERIKGDVPAGSEIEVTIEVDASRLVRTKAYIPILDEEYENVLRLERRDVAPAQLRVDFESEMQRLAEIRRKAQQKGSDKALQVLQRIELEGMEEDVRAVLGAAEQDRDAADKCAKRLLDLQQAVDDAEDALL